MAATYINLWDRVFDYFDDEIRDTHNILTGIPNSQELTDHLNELNVGRKHFENLYNNFLSPVPEFLNYASQVMGRFNQGRVPYRTTLFIRTVESFIIHNNWEDEAWPPYSRCPPHRFAGTEMLWSYCIDCNRTARFNRDTGKYEITYGED